MSLLLGLEHDFNVDAFLGAQLALLLAQVEALVLVGGLLGLDQPVYFELVGVADLE